MPEGQHCIRSPYDLPIMRGFLHFAGMCKTPSEIEGFSICYSLIIVRWINTFPSSVSHNHMATSLSMFPHGIVSPSFPDLPLHNASLLL